MYIFETSKFVRKHLDMYTVVDNLNNAKRNDRNLNKLHVPLTKLKLVSSSPHFMAIKIYNKLPNSIKSIENANLFNNKLKMYLVNNCFYSLDEFFSSDL